MNIKSSTKTEKLFLRKKLMQIDSLFFSFVALITEKKGRRYKKKFTIFGIPNTGLALLNYVIRKYHNQHYDQRTVPSNS